MLQIPLPIPLAPEGAEQGVRFLGVSKAKGSSETSPGVVTGYRSKKTAYVVLEHFHPNSLLVRMT